MVDLGWHLEVRWPASRWRSDVARLYADASALPHSPYGLVSARHFCAPRTGDGHGERNGVRAQRLEATTCSFSFNGVAGSLAVQAIYDSCLFAFNSGYG